MTLSGFDKVKKSQEVGAGMLMLTVNILYTIMNFRDYNKLKDRPWCFVDDKVLEISGGWRWHDDADALICIL